MPELSIIIVSRNTKELTKGAIESILAEGSDTSKEIIVVDNGSTDGTVEVLNKLETGNWKLEIIFNDTNVGFAKANNQGIKAAQGKYLLLLNSDTLVKKGAIGELLAFATEAPDAGVVGARLLNSDGSLQKSCFHFPTLGRAIREYWLGQKGQFEPFAPEGDGPERVDALVGAAFLITPAAYKRVGLLDERYFMYFEDLDYCKRVRQAGLKVYYLPSAKVIHHLGQSGRQEGQKKQTERIINASKAYHGILGYYLLTLVLWLGQKWEFFSKKLK